MQVGRFNILGHAVSGVESCLVVPELRAVFDIGFCPTEAVRYRHVFVTHGHPDHLAACVQHAATRSLMNAKRSVFVVPPELASGLEAVMDVWNEFQPHTFGVDVVALAPGERFKLGKGFEVEAFKTDHTMPSQGYVVLERRSKLKPEFEGLPGVEIGNLRNSGVEISDVVEVPVFAYTGDTRPSVFETVPVLLEAEVVVTEATFVTDDLSVEFAAERGHTHLSQIAAVEFGAHQHVVLTHFSQRYDAKVVDEAVAALECAAKVSVTPFPGED